jgi:hypothetical protein
MVIFNSYVKLPEGNDCLMGFSMQHPFSQSPLPLSPGPFQGRGRNNPSRRAGPATAGWKTLEVWERLGLELAMDFDRFLVGVDEV